MSRQLKTRGYFYVVGACLMLLFGCGTFRETLPARSAMEQMLISTAADRAVEELPTDSFEGKAVFLDTKNLECLDKAYVVQRIRTALLDSGARMAASGEQADLVLEAASGALSINKRDALFGIPSIPLPIPYAGETLKLPEVPFWKMVTYRGRAKFLFSVVDVDSSAQASSLPLCYGKARDSHWWIFVFGPIRNSNLPREER